MPEVKPTIYKSTEMQAIHEMVPTLLHNLGEDDNYDLTFDGLKQILSSFTLFVLNLSLTVFWLFLSVKTYAVPPHILPKLIHLPLFLLSPV